MWQLSTSAGCPTAGATPSTPSSWTRAPGIRVTLERNPELPTAETDSEAIGLAVQELVSGTGAPNRGIGLWMTVTEMRKPGRRLMLHSCAGLLTMYGDNELEMREIERRQGVVVRLTIPA